MGKTPLLPKIVNKIFKYHHLSAESPTHYQLIRCLEAEGWRYASNTWFGGFAPRHLNFAPDLCECLEFKHYLAQLVQQSCPTLMPETYFIDTHTWSMVLTDIAYAYRDLSDLTWILKPALLNNGQEIKLFRDLTEIEAHFLNPRHLDGPHVLQRYLSSPDLYQGCKYSLRYFVIVTQEAGAFLYRHGYANLALKPYSSENYKDLSLHLTNEHLKEGEPNIRQIPSSEGEFSRHFPAVLAQTQALCAALETFFPGAFVMNNNRTMAFFGFDFLVDSQKRVWLLEANHGPCFPIEDNHPLASSLYQDFWQAVYQKFVNPILRHQPISLTEELGFIPMR